MRISIAKPLYNNLCRMTDRQNETNKCYTDVKNPQQNLSNEIHVTYDRHSEY